MKRIQLLRNSTLFRLLPVLICVTMMIQAGCRNERRIKMNDNVAGIIKATEAALNRQGDPSQDFYEFACGGWLRDTKIPPDASSTDRSFSVVKARNQAFVQDLLNGKVESKDRDGLGQLKVYYQSCMDEAAVERLGLSPLQPWLDQIASVSDLTGFFKVTGLLQAIGVPVLFGSTVFPDSKKPTVNLLQLTQGGLGMPGPSFYSTPSSPLYQEYASFAQKLFILLSRSSDQAVASGKSVIDFETELAGVSATFEQLNDTTRTYNPTSFDDFKKKTPHLAWNALFEAQGLALPQRVNIQVPTFFDGLEKILPKTDITTLQDYLTFRLVSALAPLLPDRFGQLYFEFYQKQLAGLSERPPRSVYCTTATINDLGDIVARQFVDTSFSDASKKIAGEMVADIEAAFKNELSTVTWMDDETRRTAAVKAEAVANQVGYPESWPDYGSLKLKESAWFENSATATRLTFRLTMDLADKPVDRQVWYTNALTVNAYYDSQRNTIVVPAGILQSPFFNSELPAAMNYGSIGMIIGHELTHGFDGNGRRFNAQGEQQDWWSAEASRQFDQRAACFVRQYSAFEVLPGLFLNGSQTLNENIADNGGLKLAYYAYQLWKSRGGHATSPIQGLDDDQLFFVAFAQTWCALYTDAMAKSLVANDPHALAKYRVNGPVTNFPDFARAFGCAEGTPMNPQTRCAIW